MAGERRSTQGRNEDKDGKKAGKRERKTETEVVVVMSKTLRPLSFAHPDAVGNCRPPIDQNVATIYRRLCYLPSSATSMEVRNWFVHDKIQFLLKDAIQQVFKLHR